MSLHEKLEKAIISYLSDITGVSFKQTGRKRAEQFRVNMNEFIFRESARHVKTQSLSLFTDTQFSEFTSEDLFQWVWNQVLSNLDTSKVFKQYLTKVLFEFAGGTSDDLCTEITKIRNMYLDTIVKNPQYAVYGYIPSEERLAQGAMESFIKRNVKNLGKDAIPTRKDGCPMGGQELKKFSPTQH